mgnify:FL=1
MRLLTTGLILAALLVVFKLCTFTTTEYNQAIIIQFGKPVGEPVTEPGLHFKAPLIQQVKYLDERILEWDGDPNQIPTKDKKYILIDVTARWRIDQALRFYQSVRNEIGAHARLDDVIDGATRNVVSNHLLVEVVRNSNAILETEGAMDDIGEREKMEKIRFGRTKLRQEIFDAAAAIVPQYGIELIDVRIKRINYEQSVQQKVFERMISERKRIAEKFRSEGKGKRAEILGRMQKELRRIESGAYRTAQEIKGDADAQVTRLYARAYSGANDFYRFLKTIESYEQTVKEDSVLFLSTDSDYLRYLKRGVR